MSKAMNKGYTEKNESSAGRVLTPQQPKHNMGTIVECTNIFSNNNNINCQTSSL